MLLHDLLLAGYQTLLRIILLLGIVGIIRTSLLRQRGQALTPLDHALTSTYLGSLILGLLLGLALYGWQFLSLVRPLPRPPHLLLVLAAVYLTYRLRRRSLQAAPDVEAHRRQLTGYGSSLLLIAAAMLLIWVG